MKLSDFFPSPTATQYMARMFLTRTFAILLAMVMVLQTLDLLSESGRILAYPGNGQAEVWRYVGMRAPEIIRFLLPFTVLLGTLLTLSTLNQNSEVIALKAAGLSAHQVLAPLFVAGIAVAALSFAFNERVVVRASATLEHWKDVDYGPLPIDRGDRANVWVRSGNDLIEVDQIRGRGDAAVLTGIHIYERDSNRLTSILSADRGVRDGNGWRVTNARRFNVARADTTPLGTVHIADGITPDQFTLTNLNTDGMSFTTLYDAIQELQRSGRPTRALEGALWHKISSPLSSVLMPLLGAVAAFGIARSGKLFMRAVAGMALGFLYFVADNFALAMGNMGVYPPFLAAWGPFFLFLMIGELVLLKTEE